MDNVALSQAPVQKPLIKVILPPIAFKRTYHQGVGSDLAQSSPPLNHTPQTPQTPPSNLDLRGGNYRPPPLILPQAPWKETKNPNAEIVQDRYLELRSEELSPLLKGGRDLALLELERYLLKQPQ